MIWLILVLAFFLRTYRVSDYLGFWFDQGRDALAIWDLLKNGNFFLIGPTTGIEGIFIGPFFYYLMTPFYWLGRGNPVYPAVFFALLNTGTIYLMYRLAKKYVSQGAGLIAAALYAFSFQWIGYHRWLANPTPLPFFAIITVWLILEIIHGSKKLWHWPALGLILGLCLQLEAASATFFLPATLVIFGIWRKNLSLGWKKLVLMGVFFGATLLPQLVFDFRNDHLLYKSFQKFLVGDQSFKPAVVNFYDERFRFYYEALTNKFSHQAWSSQVFTLSLLGLALWMWRKLPQKFVLSLLIWLLTPVVFFLFYHGNNGYVWDYYFTGVYPALCILIGSVYMTFWQFTKNWIRWAPLVLVGVLLWQNLTIVYDYYFRKDVAPFIALTQMRDAVDWVYQDAAGDKFNFDVYVPPVLYESYKYVFLWRGETEFKRQPAIEQVTRLYTLREPDDQHPQFLEKWLVRQSTIGSIEETKQFGVITVERRKRFKNE